MLDDLIAAFLSADKAMRDNPKQPDNCGKQIGFGHCAWPDQCVSCNEAMNAHRRRIYARRKALQRLRAAYDLADRQATQRPDPQRRFGATCAAGGRQ